MSKTVDDAVELGFSDLGPESSHSQDTTDGQNGDVKSKHALIARACQASDIDELIKLSTSKGGLLNDELRQKACE
jgi:hypothetical protein